MASIVQIFFVVFPQWFLEDVIMEKTDERMDIPITLGEIMRWIGIWFLLDIVPVNNRKDFWNTNILSIMDSDPFRVNDIMS